LSHPDTISSASRAVTVAEAPAFPAVTAGTVGSVAIQTVDGRALHAFLDVGRDFTNWIKGRIQTYGFEKGVDYEVFAGFGENPSDGSGSPNPGSGKPKGGRPTSEYALTLDMAKELGMVENNERGRMVRRYFIDCERKAKAPRRATALKRPPSHRSLASTWAWAESLSERLGISDANQKALGANALTERITGVDVLGAMGIKHLVAPQQEVLLTATEIGERLGEVSARFINARLLELGFQSGSPGAYEPTEKGIAAGGVMLDVARGNGTGNSRQLRWASGIVDQLRPLIAAA